MKVFVIVPVDVNVNDVEKASEISVDLVITAIANAEKTEGVVPDCDGVRVHDVDPNA